jgi:hypothetical protein
MDKFRHFRMRAQRLWAGVMPSQFGLCEQGMDLLVTCPVHENGDITTPRFGNQVVCISQSWGYGAITERTDRQRCCFV